MYCIDRSMYHATLSLFGPRGCSGNSALAETKNSRILAYAESLLSTHHKMAAALMAAAERHASQAAMWRCDCVWVHATCDIFDELEQTARNTCLHVL